MTRDLLVSGRASMEAEAEAISCAARRMDDQFLSAVRLIEEQRGRS